MSNTQSGYTHCACRDCMDTTVSSDTSKPELCEDCKEAGCEAAMPVAGMLLGGDCQRDDAYEDETPVNPQCSCRDCTDVSTTAAKGGWTLCRACLDAACTPYPPGTGEWPFRRPAGEYGCRREG